MNKILRPKWYENYYNNDNILDLSNNICYDGILLSELNFNINHFNISRYPDPAKTYKILSRYLDIDVKNIAIGYGAGDIILRLLQNFKDYSIKIIVPTYELARIFSINLGMKVITDNNEGAEILYIANPNGVTGVAITKEEIILLVKKYKYVIVDEAYADFATNGCSVLTEIQNFKNLIVIKTFSKSIASPGLRFGYCVGDLDIIEDIQNNRPSTVMTNITPDIVSHLLPKIKDHVSRMLETRNYIENKYECVLSQGNFTLFKNNPNFNCKIKETEQQLIRMALTDIKTFKRLENEIA